MIHAGTSTGPQILLVEDDPADVILIRENLDLAYSGNFTLEHRDRLDTALERLGEGDIDIVVLDLTLPDCQGIETFRRIQELEPDLPVVVLTGLDDEQVAMRIVGMGAQDFLVKGRFDSDLLARSLGYALERQNLKKQLLQSQKMEAIGRLAGGVAHDFNNLVTIISGYCQLLQFRTSDVGLVEECIEQITQATERASSLIGQLMIFSRRDVIQPKVIDLNEVIEALSKMLRRLIREDINCTVATADRVPEVKADPGQIEQVLINLALNARDAMPRGGTLELATERVSLQNPFITQNGPIGPGEFAVLRITDSGEGMDEPLRRRIFEPFFTTKDAQHGTGLGLFMVKDIISQYNGRIDVTSEPGSGTTFRIYLPAAGKAKEVDSVPEIPTELRGGKERVLVVEDDKLVRRMIRTVLESNGYSVFLAADGREGLEQLEDAGAIDLVISDVVMPEMNGVDLAQAVERKSPETKILLISGYSNNTLVRLILDQNRPFLAKPFPPSGLLNTIREILDD